MPLGGWNKDNMKRGDVNQQMQGFSQKGKLCSLVLLYNILKCLIIMYFVFPTTQKGFEIFSL